MKFIKSGKAQTLLVLLFFASVYAQPRNDSTGGDNPTNPVISCKNCHQEIFEEWLLTGHANSIKNHRVMDLYRGTAGEGLELKNMGPGYKHDFPGTSGNCAFCHAPLEAAKKPFKTELEYSRGNSFLNRSPDVRYLTDSDEGISCNFCHDVKNVRYYKNSSRPGLLSYKVAENQTDSESKSCNNMIWNNNVLKKNKFCAPCHSYKFGNVSVYGTYDEWEATGLEEKGLLCVKCHMTDKNGGLSHLIKSPKDINFLKNAVELKEDIRNTGSQLEIDIEVKNTGAGHHFPTGSPLRNAILLVEVLDDKGGRLKYLGNNILSDYAGTGTEFGDYEGMPGRIYAKILKTNAVNYKCNLNKKKTGRIGQDFSSDENKKLFAFWRPVHIEEDTRIPYGKTDKSSYIFKIEEHQEYVNVNIRLIYRKSLKPLSKIKLWKTNDVLIKNIIKEIRLK